MNLDEKIRNLFDIVKKKKEFCLKDKEESLKNINKHFDIIIKKVEERRAWMNNKTI